MCGAGDAKNDSSEEGGWFKKLVLCLGLILLPLVCAAVLLAVFAGFFGAVVLYKEFQAQYQVQLIIVIVAYVGIGFLMATLSKDGMRRFSGALIATGTLLPATMVITTVVLYCLGYVDQKTFNSEGRFALFWGSTISVWGWFVVSFVCRRFADFENAIHSSYSEFGQRFSQLKSAFKVLCPEITCNSSTTLKCNNPTLAVAYKEIRCQIEKIDDELKKTGIPWVVATGYINVWGRLYSAEEALIEVLPQEKVIAGAIHDELRLEGSEITQRDELLAKLRQAVCVIDPGSKQFLKATSTTPLLVVSTPSQEARAVLRTIRASINEYREGLWNGLILARNRLLATLFLTSLTVYILLVIALIANAQKESVLAASTFYVVGAAIGLGSRLRSESENKTGVYDYGLSAAGLVTLPIFSGLTALGGVFLVAMLPYAGQILGPLHSTPLTMVTAPQLREGTVSTSYFEQLTASGGTEPYKWTLKANGKDAIPDALELSDTGEVSGTPTNKGSGRFTVQVTDSTGSMIEKMFTLTIKPLPEKISKPAVDTTSPLPAGTVGKNFSKRLQAIGGTPPYKWSFIEYSTGTQLKDIGLKLDKDTGELSGTPNEAKTLNFKVKVEDANKKVDEKSLSLFVKQTEQTLGSSTVTGSGAGGSIPSLKDIFNLHKNLGGILVAAIFGLTPGLLFDKLKQLTDKRKEDLKNSQAPQVKQVKSQT